MEPICQHLASCESCEAYLANIEDAKEGVVGNLRQFLHHEPWINQEEFQAVEARAKAISLEGPIPFAPGDAGDASPPEQVSLPQLGKYELIRILGQGGMGVVYAARHTRLNRKVAVKVISPEHAANGRVRARFLREMKAIGELSHVNIVAATDADEVEGRPYLVMELVEGFNLDALLRLCGPLAVDDVCEIIRQAALGLQYVHEHNRVHRDLKPSNLMLSREGVVKILDLGLTRIFSEGSQSEELTRSQAMMGTADYMAPEQWDDSHNADIRADIYSLGCTLYKLLAGNAPFSDPEFKPKLKKKLAHIHLQVPPLRSHRPDVPAALAAVVERMLQKDPAQRYGVPKEAAAALAPFAESSDCQQLVAEALRQTAGALGGDVGKKAAASETVGERPETPGYARRSRDGKFPGGFWCKRWRWVVGFGALCPVLAVAALFVGGWLGNQQQLVTHETKMEAARQPGRWDYPLRDREPIKLIQTDVGGSHSSIYSKDKEEFEVYARDLALFSLGTVDRPSYRLQIEIKQTRGIGGVGLFFGYHAAMVEGLPCFKCQYLELRVDVAPAAKGGFRLVRGWVTFQPKEQALKILEESPSSAQLERRKVKEDNQLDMVVEHGQLTNVRWNTELLKFVGPESVFPYTNSDFVGEFGTFNRTSFGIYTKAAVFLYER